MPPRTARSRQLAVNLAEQTQGYGHLMRGRYEPGDLSDPDQARPGNKRLFGSLELDTKYPFRQERTLLYSVRRGCTSWKSSFAQRYSVALFLLIHHQPT